MMQSSELRPMPPFVDDKFALKVLLEAGGTVSGVEVKDYVKANYDLSNFPHALDYLTMQLKSLWAHGYLGRTKSKVAREQRYFITPDAMPLVEKMLK